ncbi:NfeD family protein [Alkalinema sp. FACHB-956]|uniref:NfeD family protein n=1 Tax=Alkalinema sp. FACHB-956 TaxID=2692768 RepID=UPI0016843269|nr:NfeD family protein [Alkalinema sp. FACHB-956]MBD2326811.1 NfeD family protein [Alkalinema sp. FACHB-956]
MASQTFWLFLGIGLCAVEAVFPTAYVALVMGISALLVAIAAQWLSLNWEVWLWIGLSLLGIWISRTFVPPRKTVKWDDKVGETLTEIQPGQLGRVLYEGNSWAARCEDPEATIPAQQPVLVVGRQGTTLLVLPEGALHG